MFGTKSLARATKEMARTVEVSGYSVDASHGEEYVKILRREDQKVMTLLEGDEAIQFIEYATQLASGAKVDIATALLAEAKSYTDTYDVLEG